MLWQKKKKRNENLFQTQDGNFKDQFWKHKNGFFFPFYVYHVLIKCILYCIVLCICIFIQSVQFKKSHMHTLFSHKIHKKKIDCLLTLKICVHCTDELMCVYVSTNDEMMI